MNKSEKIICLLLGAALAWYVWSEFGRAKERAKYAAAHPAAVAVATNAAAQAEAARTEPAAGEATKAPAAVEPAPAKPSVPEKVVVLENEELKLELSSWGAVVKKATLKKYAKDRGEISDENPPVVFDFSDSPLGAGAVVEAFEVAEEGADSVRFVNGAKSRTIRLGADYRITLDDDGIGGAVSLGQMRMGDSSPSTAGRWTPARASRASSTTARATPRSRAISSAGFPAAAAAPRARRGCPRRLR